MPQLEPRLALINSELLNSSAAQLSVSVPKIPHFPGLPQLQRKPRDFSVDLLSTTISEARPRCAHPGRPLGHSIETVRSPRHPLSSPRERSRCRFSSILLSALAHPPIPPGQPGNCGKGNISTKSSFARISSKANSNLKTLLLIPQKSKQRSSKILIANFNFCGGRGEGSLSASPTAVGCPTTIQLHVDTVHPDPRFRLPST